MFEKSDVVVEFNEFGHVVSEKYKSLRSYFALLQAIHELETLGEKHGFRVRFSKNESHTRFDGVVLPPEFSTCVNVIKLNTPVGWSTFCFTSAENTTWENVQHCINFIKSCIKE